MKLFKGRRPRRYADMTFGAFTPEMARDQDNARIVAFIEARAREIDLPSAQACLRVIDDCCSRIDGSGIDGKPFWLRGAVKDMKPLKRLARNWADHPDFLPEWSE